MASVQTRHAGVALERHWLGREQLSLPADQVPERVAGERVQTQEHEVQQQDQ